MSQMGRPLPQKLPHWQGYSAQTFNAVVATTDTGKC